MNPRFLSYGGQGEILEHAESSLSIFQYLVAPCDVACITCQGLAARGADADVSLNVVDRAGLTPSQYVPLESALMETADYYTYVDVAEFLPTAATNLSMVKMRFVQNMCFARCAVGVFIHSPG
jgi:hypothetical protein